MDFSFLNRLLSGLRACHAGVTANQVQMFLVIAENPGITATQIAKKISLPGENFVTVSSVARGLDVLGRGRQQVIDEEKVDPETGLKFKTGRHLNGNVTQMGLIRWDLDARGRRSAFYLTKLGEDLLEDARAPKLELLAA